MSEKIKVMATSHLPMREATPGDTITVTRTEAAELYANGLIEDPKIEGAVGPTIHTGMVSPSAPGIVGQVLPVTEDGSSVRLADKRGRRS